MIPESVKAPIKIGDKIGVVNYYIGDKLIGSSDVVASESIDIIGFWDLLLKFVASMSLF